MIILNSKKILKIIKKKKHLVITKAWIKEYTQDYDVDQLGFNYRMSELHASLE